MKFILATTEVQKVPVTILSRCQRFDLRRIPAALLAAHFTHVTDAEHVRAEPAALALIAEAAEGSARDGLSMLDQAIAFAEGGEGAAGGDGGGAADAPLVTATAVRAMLGLSDRAAIRRLMAHLLEGRAGEMLDGVRDHYALGVEPLALIRGLLELTHGIMLDKLGRGGTDADRSAEERAALAGWSTGLGFAELHRLWQLLLKAHGEVMAAALPIEAAEMALLRCVHAASMPDPGAIARLLQGGGSLGGAGGGSGEAAAGPADGGQSSAGQSFAGQSFAGPPAALPQPRDMLAASQSDAGPAIPASFAAMVEALHKHAPIMANTLHDKVELIRYAPPELVIRPTRLQDANTRDIATCLNDAFGIRWAVSIGDGPAEPSLLAQEQAGEAAAREAILDMPLVKAAMTAFPDAELLGTGTTH